MDAEPTLAVAASGEAETAKKTRSGKRKEKAGKVNMEKKSRSGKHTPGKRRASGNHLPKARGRFKDMVTLRGSVAQRDFDKQTEEQAAELSVLRRRIAALGLEVDIANKQRFKAQAILERFCGRTVARLALM